jgi:predicted Zn-dependent protease
LFEVLIAQRQRNPSIVEGWFSTHPLEESRIEHARGLIARSGADQASGLMQNISSYADFKRRVAALPEPRELPAQR